MGARIALHLEDAERIARGLDEVGIRLSVLSREVPSQRLDDALISVVDTSAALELRRASTLLREVSADLERRRRQLLNAENANWSPNGRVLISIVAAALLRKKIARAIKKVFPKNPITELLKKAKAYQEIAAEASGGVFWGNYCGKGNNNPGGKIPDDEDDRAPALDALDRCCLAHDLGYGDKGVGGDNQFSPKNIWKVRKVNATMAACAARARSSVAGELNPTRPPNIKGEDAAEGVVGLFGGMAALGAAIEKAIDAVASIRTISRSQAERLVFAAIEVHMAPVRARVDVLEALI